jgi:hypothetical protein
MSRYEKEILEDIGKRLKVSDPKKWNSLSTEEKDLVVKTYYYIRDIEYQNLIHLLREHAGERKQFIYLILGIGMGLFASPISTIALKYFPSESVWDDLRTGVFFALLLYLFVKLIFRASAESLGDENVIDRLLEAGKQMWPKESSQDTDSNINSHL